MVVENGGNIFSKLYQKTKMGCTKQTLDSDLVVWMLHTHWHSLYLSFYVFLKQISKYSFQLATYREFFPVNAANIQMLYVRVSMSVCVCLWITCADIT